MSLCSSESWTKRGRARDARERAERMAETIRRLNVSPGGLAHEYGNPDAPDEPRYPATCPGCGAPVKDVLCPYCGRMIDNGARLRYNRSIPSSFGGA